ncbi:protein of unknown function [Candidatus Promineifilum breve]|uniref:PpiC domain-containing protein n=1 Tax=Candidatus Promineifilum breve TaxID=1806508 RepID=A0A160T183_9CHLR|nr:SurA N-terminal domain-containing protein [Candidatus Promineifilum breve]CUS02548.2 protein of unknown function [Candidatus Promineifilum breve]
MAKKQQTPKESEAEQRQSRKELLIARKHERQLRNIRIAAIVIGVMIALVIGIAVVNELFLTPNRAVATVGQTQITLREWQERVKFERAQRVIFLENQLAAFGGDVGIVQQFGGSVINELYDPETMGQDVLNTMADEVVICEAVEERGIEINEADVQAKIGESYSFYGEGVSPTQQPEPTATVQPTPSLTPIPTAVITDVVPTLTPFPTPTTGPAATPLPTATPVPEEEFLTQYGEFIAQLNNLGVQEPIYRQVVRAQLCRERLTEALTEEQALPRLAPHASLFFLAASTEEAANEMQGLIETDGFLPTWNGIVSRPADPAATEQPETDAFELLWRTQSNLEASIGAEIATAAFTLDIDQPSEIFTVDNGDGTSSYYQFMVSGREERELSDNEFQTAQQEAVQSYVDERLTGNLQINDMWRGRVPTLPVLDAKFLASATATPEIETVPTLAPVPAEGE